MISLLKFYTVRKFELPYSCKFNITPDVMQDTDMGYIERIYTRYKKEVIYTNLCNQVPLT